MKIKWLGHACFLLTSKDGARILTDPFDNQVGYALPAEEADIVTSSHDHFDHNNFSVVRGRFVKINRAGRFSEKGIKIRGVKTYHDESKGAKRGGNIVYIFDIDGLKVCHCGDLGHMPTEEQKGEIGKVDVLLLPVGGTYTVDAAGANEIVKALNPAVTIPMHFKTPDMNFPIEGVDKFLAVAGGGEKLNRQEVEINRENIASLPGVIVLNYCES